MNSTNENSAFTPAQRIEAIDLKTTELMSLLNPPAGVSKIDLALQALGELLQGQQVLIDLVSDLRTRLLTDKSA